jgi:hypothetical protein
LIGALALIGGLVVAGPPPDALAGPSLSIDVLVASGTDDVEELPDGFLYVESSDLELVTDETDQQVVGLRFTDVQIPTGATILDAWIEFTSDEVDAVATGLTIRGIAEADAAPFSGRYGVTNRSTTTSSAGWSPGEWARVGIAHRTPDLTAIVSELTGPSGGWEAGNALGFTISGTGTRVADSYEGAPTQAPLLHVEYTIGGSTNAPPTLIASASEVGPDGRATLTGEVTDDGLPDPPSLTWEWTQTAGPAADIADPTALVTEVTLTESGTHAFALTASDGAITVSASVVVTNGGAVGPQPLLPDLVSTAPDPGRQRYTIGDPTFPDLDGHLLLRFDGYVTNVGDGPLHVTGNPQHLNPSDLNSHDVWQWVAQTDGSLVRAQKVPIQFENDDDHNHFHFMDLVEYSLLEGDGSGGSVVLMSAKVGFCLSDTETIPGFPNPGPQTYYYATTLFCSQDDPGAVDLFMGVTQGWHDVYGWETNFQWFDVSDVVPGEYRISTTTDPNDLVIEKDEVNLPALAPEPTIVPGHAPTASSAATPAATAIDVTLTSDRFESDFDGAPVVGVPVYSIESLPTEGTLDVGIGPLDGDVVRYTPGPGFEGTDSFVFGVRDSLSPFPFTTPTATVTIEVTGGGTVPNTPPTVDVGARPVDSSGNRITLEAVVGDDGLPAVPGSITWRWSQTSGPAASIADPNATTTTATLSTPGTYVFAGTADDGDLATTAEVEYVLPDTSGAGGVFRIATSTDDTEELASGTLYQTSSDIELAVDSSTQTIGLRFTDVGIPAGSEITSAWIQFTVDEISTGPVSLQIAAERSPDAAPFAGRGSVSGRSLTDAIAWSPPDWTAVGAAGPAQRTPDLSALIEAVVAQPGWDEGNAIAVVITGSGTRTAESFDGSPAAAATLHLSWNPPPPGANRPPAVSVSGTGGPVGSSASLTAVVSDDGLPDPPGATTIEWRQTAGPASTIDAPAAASTAATLPEVGEYTFEVTVSDGDRSTVDEVTITAFDPATTVLEARVPIASGGDDVEELPSGYLYVDSSDLELTEEGGLQQVIGLRFASLAIPQGATIRSARIEFTVDEVGTAPTSLTIAIADTTDAPVWAGRSAVSSTPVRGTVVTWAPAGWTTVGARGPDQTTPDLGPLLGPVVGSPGWTSGNAVAFVITGSGGRIAESFEGTGPPILVVEYTLP